MLKNFHAGILFELGKTDAFYEEIKEISEKDKRYKSFEEYVQKIQQERKDEYKEFLNEIQEKILQKQQELEKNEDTKTYLDLSLLSLFSGNKDEALNYLKKALDLGQKD
jgi:tetratricopeptide (TPR) repeat protein